ncbi:hypothetical protein CONPUDRAFT_157974 [Coniophora puteana RWD-64-598 SS2]|uniref:DUF6533 domain-containing protein n=1 Tax=Coniophora puteana (strain RWD-64-598) TaxID=741705 RepID=A0A5M3MC91_CONPW|nr:uncharacterized protein CONPUDRAFT_157974 [Coniophora puteana RWD-64-598 SS2]EIW76818.1 hypothetical protein CONPUDRAFT_157974 [Coniophora puteana RWD-64-598 SS2]
MQPLWMLLDASGSDYILRETLAAGQRASRHANVAGLALLVYDYLLTLHFEARWIWGRRWDATRVLFTLARYTVFTAVIFTAYCKSQSFSSPGGVICLFLPMVLASTGVYFFSSIPSCEAFNRVSDVLHLASMVMPETLFILRVWYLWNRSKLAMLFLLSVAVVLGAVSTLEAQSTGGAITDNPDSLCEGRHPLNLTVATQGGALQFAAYALYELVILCMTQYRKLREHQDCCELRDSFLATLYRDSSLYMVGSIVLSVVNVGMILVFPAYSDLFNNIQTAFQSIIASRVVFDLRESDDRKRRWSLGRALDDSSFPEALRLGQ